ncbi:maleylpyruvate isomerase family mycothiol-dependent enzyme [Candidatus Mycobacterium wuenschmannii]|uniref:Maleylpyruvate isomerase family mycothiol-dependent enzyme n=1 Tax=Candidatus Mycobacterium wuenschmannii TaxID=3027808 RepID=A0ABY8W196_9MYCO|nr:maleylpyruvate isomerase family mycothiol-dependent enzyme [Candidatus Mycobacterium wuenschmannii]WIM89638.1 maleylpyruvate isomerase family mycothiol-dependent enzyme [Candidatus Mycobacterium wuenschmannii]
MVDHEFVFAAVAHQRREFAQLIEGLDDAQLATPSLCRGWDVKTVAAHVVSTVLDGMPGFLKMAVRCGSLDRGIDTLARRRAQAPTTDIVADLHANADRPVSSPVFGPRGPLADILVHTGDVRIALGLPFQPDVERTATAVDFLTGGWPIGFVSLGRLRGIRLSANDIDRRWRDGAEISGPVATLMMGICGRTTVLAGLTGPGLPVLRGRLS